MEVKKSGIYLIENLLNHKLYIGQSIDLERREEQHLAALTSHTHHNAEMQNDLSGLSLEQLKFFIVFKIIELCPAEELDKKEAYYINYYRAEYGNDSLYNA